ncbi:VacJ family lipoprotein [Elstera sp.]|jgi:phospholipid-binding lipoprotein MlaA|uniref:VacJ family lipoprotein n=1 Tax=Elstera sp. TaxID=1916664 RepID=UPI0037BF0C6B
MTPMPASLSRLCRVLPLVAVLGLGACASSQTAENDPIEGFNRGVFAVNDALDQAVIRPVAYGYREAVPEPIRDRVRDFVANLASPVILLNDLLQGEFDRAGTTFTRFWINTIAGVGGLVDIASSVGIQRHTEDFGQTMATWGAGEGAYLVLPLLGPSNPRDAIGKVVDIFTDPMTYIFGAHGPEWGPYALTGTRIIDGRSRIIRETDDLRRNSFDYYATIRSIYRQQRADEIANGRAKPGNTPSYPGQNGN